MTTTAATTEIAIATTRNRATATTVKKTGAKKTGAEAGMQKKEQMSTLRK